MNAGESYIHRIEPQQIKSAQDKGFRATADFSEIGEVDAILICVPTPLSDHHTPDMSYIAATMDSIVDHLRPGQLVVLENTTYPGTTEELIAPAIERAGRVKVIRQAMLPDGVLVAYSPEREDPGNTSIDRREIPKVVGGLGNFAAEAAETLYSVAFRRVIRVSSPAAAEMTKLLENIYRCVNIALVNELKLLCLRMGIDIWEVIAAAATKPFGFQPFYPGPGLGGHCIPIDPFYLSWKAKEFDFSTRFIELAGEVNEAMPYHVVAAVSSALNQRGKPLKGSRILVLGLAYKRDVDDLRESPSLSIIEMLQQEGAAVSYNDPFFPTVGRGRKYNLNMESQPLDHLDGYDCVLLSPIILPTTTPASCMNLSLWWTRETPHAARSRTKSLGVEMDRCLEEHRIYKRGTRRRGAGLLDSDALFWIGTETHSLRGYLPLRDRSLSANRW